MIKLNKINKYYNRKKNNEIHVINDTSLELPSVGLISLLGKSGSGKTTLLNVMSGLDNYDEGKITIDDIKVEKYKSNIWDAIRSKKIGYIFQNYYLFNDKTVYENLDISLRLAGLVDRVEIDKRIDYALTLVGLLKFKKRTPASMSGGQQQRIGIARAIVKGPSIIIADEPTGNLDSDNTFEIMDMLKSISKKCLVVLVTHEEDIAKFFSDRIIRLVDGKITSDEINESQDDLNVIDNKRIYIKDLKVEKSTEVDNITINYNGNQESKYIINLIEKDGKLFINSFKSSEIVFLDNTSEIKVIDAHYTDKKKGEHKSVLIDSDILSPVDYKLKSKSFSMMTSLKAAWKNYKLMPKKRKRVNKIVLFLLAVIMTISISLMASYIVYDEESYVENKGLVTLGTTNYLEMIRGEEGHHGIKKVLLGDGIIRLKPFYNYSLDSTDLLTTRLYPEYLKDSNVSVIGKNIIENDNEAIIDISSANAALLVLNNFGIYDMNSLINEEILYNNYIFKIVGISDIGFSGALINDEIYESILDEYYLYTGEGVYQEGPYVVSTGLPYDYYYYQDYRMYYVLCDDKVKLEKWSYDNGLSYYDNYQTEKDRFNNTQKTSMPVLIILISLSFIIMLIISAQTVKSRFINRIKELGTYRCIGVKKGDLLKDFIFEILIILAFSAFIGVIVVSGAMKFLGEMLIILFGDFNTSLLNPLLTFALILLINIGLTVKTIMSLLRLTPAEIMAKYDI